MWLGGPCRRRPPRLCGEPPCRLPLPFPNLCLSLRPFDSLRSLRAGLCGLPGRATAPAVARCVEGRAVCLCLSPICAFLCVLCASAVNRRAVFWRRAPKRPKPGAFKKFFFRKSFVCNDLPPPPDFHLTFPESGVYFPWSLGGRSAKASLGFSPGPLPGNWVQGNSVPRAARLVESPVATRRRGGI